MITQKILKERYSYDPESGDFRSLRTGSVVGYVLKRKNRNTGYKAIKILGKSNYLHRMAFLYMSGEIPDQVDHINRDGLDNRWANLRPSSGTLNSRNRGAYRNNRSGVMGVNWQKSNSKWVAKIDLPDRLILGYYKNFFDACCARKSAELKYGFSCG